MSGFIRVLYTVILNSGSNCRLLRDSSCRRNLVGDMSGEAGNRKEEARKTGLEGTGLPLPGGSHGSVRCAGSDPQLRHMLDSLKSSKASVSVVVTSTCLRFFI